MNLDYQNIFKGFVNSIFKDKVVEQAAVTRLAQCHICPLRDGGVCSKKKAFNGVIGCGCALMLKARSGSKCPLNKW